MRFGLHAAGGCKAYFQLAGKLLDEGEGVGTPGNKNLTARCPGHGVKDRWKGKQQARKAWIRPRAGTGGE